MRRGLSAAGLVAPALLLLFAAILGSAAGAQPPDVVLLPVSDIQENEFTVGWQAYDIPNFRAYLVSLKGPADADFPSPTEFTDETTKAIRAYDLKPGSDYILRVVVEDDSGSRSNGVEVSVHTKGTAPPAEPAKSRQSNNPLYQLFATPGAACGLSFFLFIIITAIFANAQKKLGSSKAKFAIPILIFAILLFVVNAIIGFSQLVLEETLVAPEYQVAFFEIAAVLTLFFTIILLLRFKFRHADKKSFAFITPIFAGLFVMFFVFVLSSNGFVAGLDQYQLPILLVSIIATIAGLAVVRARVAVIRNRHEAEERESRIRAAWEDFKRSDDRANDLYKKGAFPEVTEAKQHLMTVHVALSQKNSDASTEPLKMATGALDRGESKAGQLETLRAQAKAQEERLSKMRIYGGFPEITSADAALKRAGEAEKSLNPDAMSSSLLPVAALIDKVEQRVRDVSQRRDGLEKRTAEAKGVLAGLVARATQDRVKFPSYGAAEAAEIESSRGHVDRARAGLSKSDSISDSSKSEKSQALDEAATQLEQFNAKLSGIEAAHGRMDELESRHGAVAEELGNLKIPGMLVDVGPMESALSRAWSALQSNRPDEAQKLLDEAAEHQDRLAQEALPRLLARPKATRFQKDSWDDLEFVVVNEGKGVARDVTVSVQGQMGFSESGNEVKFEDLPPATEARGKVNVKFTETGKIQVRFALSYYDFLGNHTEGPFTTHNMVVDAPKQGPQSVVIHGDVRTEIKDNIIQRGTLSVGGGDIGSTAGDAGADAAEVNGNVVSRSRVSVTTGSAGSPAPQSAMMYRSAVKTAVFNDGQIDAMERQFLDGLKREWEVDDATSATVEREMLEEYARYKLSTPAICPGCRQEVKRGWKLCPMCGSKL